MPSNFLVVKNKIKNTQRTHKKKPLYTSSSSSIYWQAHKSTASDSEAQLIFMFTQKFALIKQKAAAEQHDEKKKKVEILRPSLEISSIYQSIYNSCDCLRLRWLLIWLLYCWGLCADICMKRKTFGNIHADFRLLFLSNRGARELKAASFMFARAFPAVSYLLVLHHVHYDPVRRVDVFPNEIFEHDKRFHEEIL